MEFINDLKELKRPPTKHKSGTYYAHIQGVARYLLNQKKKKDIKIFSKEECDSVISRELNRAIIHNRSLATILLTLQLRLPLSPSCKGNLISTIKTILHPYDYVFKLENEKYVLLLPETNQKEAVEKGMQIKAQLEALNISVGIGVSSYHTAHAEGLETHLNASPRLKHA